MTDHGLRVATSSRASVHPAASDRHSGGDLPPTPDRPSAREILNSGPEHHANNVGLDAAPRRVCSVFEYFRPDHFGNPL